MKKVIFWSICLLVIIGFAVICVLENEVKYPTGKDTIKSFGNGTYQISSGSNESLFNEEYGSCIIEQVEKFRETGNKVYVVGTTIHEYIADGVKVERGYRIYSVIELEKNTMVLCVTKNNPSQPDLFIYRLDDMIDNGDISLIKNLSDFSNEDLKVFQMIAG